jgi:hypothetical protein
MGKKGVKQGMGVIRSRKSVNTDYVRFRKKNSGKC